MREVQWRWLYVLHMNGIFELDSIVLICLQMIFFIYHPPVDEGADATSVHEITFMTQIELIATILKEYLGSPDAKQDGRGDNESSLEADSNTSSAR